MARLEGFEPPTLRSEIVSNADQHVSATSKIQRLGVLASMLVRADSAPCGNTDGNKNRLCDQLASLYFSTNSVACLAVDENKIVTNPAIAVLSPNPQNSANLRPTQQRSPGVSCMAFRYSRLRFTTVPAKLGLIPLLKFSKKTPRTEARSVSSDNPAPSPASAVKYNSQQSSSSNRSSPISLAAALRGDFYLSNYTVARGGMRRLNW